MSILADRAQARPDSVEDLFGFGVHVAESAPCTAPVFAVSAKTSVVALLGSGVLVLISASAPRHYLASVEWETLLFFAGLFVMVGALVETGVIATLARLATDATGGDALFAVMLVLFVSALLSGFIDNIPYVATMSPLVAELAAGSPTPGTRRHCGGRWSSARTSAAISPPSAPRPTSSSSASPNAPALRSRSGTSPRRARSSR